MPYTASSGLLAINTSKTHCTFSQTKMSQTGVILFYFSRLISWLDSLKYATQQNCHIYTCNLNG